jgi:hypothetical protein
MTFRLIVGSDAAVTASGEMTVIAPTPVAAPQMNRVC